MADLMVAQQSAVVRKDGKRHVITAWRTMLPADDPLVKGRERLFRPVESATAEPGEVRAMRRKKAQPVAAETTDIKE
jgi:hypothetical protein